jgi:ribonuclease HII
MEAPDFQIETSMWGQGWHVIAGVDEAGRGPLAGPVVAAAVVLDPDDIPDGLNDSKKLSAQRRDMLAAVIRKKADVGVGLASVAEIDQINILQASHLAMRRALADLPANPDGALIDGHRLPNEMDLPALAVVKGDARSLSIAAASIIAKTVRDKIMWDLHQIFPDYGWDRNAGYPTAAHRQALLEFGITPHHRRSFRPVHNILCSHQAPST